MPTTSRLRGERGRWEFPTATLALSSGRMGCRRFDARQKIREVALDVRHLVEDEVRLREARRYAAPTGARRGLPRARCQRRTSAHPDSRTGIPARRSRSHGNDEAARLTMAISEPVPKPHSSAVFFPHSMAGQDRATASLPPPRGMPLRRSERGGGRRCVDGQLERIGCGSERLRRGLTWSVVSHELLQ